MPPSSDTLNIKSDMPRVGFDARHTNADSDVILSISTRVDFCPHLVGKNSREMLVTVIALKHALLVNQ